MFLDRPTSGAADSAGCGEAAFTVINQLTELVRSENEDIAGPAGAKLHEYNLKKSQALLALRRVAPLIARLAPNAALGASLIELRTELETNRRLLDLQLRAAQAVADLITRAIYEGQSDGTYSALPWKDDVS
jgi:hypothetical protein